MTDFGKRHGDMLKSEYDPDDDGVIAVAQTEADMLKSDYDADEDGTVDDSEKLSGSTKAQVQDHTPNTHTHTEAQITDLDHDALKIKGVPVDDAAIADGKVLTYQSASGKIEYITPSPAGAAISSIQRGTITIASGDASNTATITSVDTTKSVLQHLGALNSQNTEAGTICRLQLTNATTVTATRVGTFGNLTVAYQVVEYSSGINSIQRGTITIADGDTSDTATITSVDTTKSVLQHLGQDAMDNGIFSSMCTLQLTNATTITATRGYGTNPRSVSWEVVEFS